jgi:hypothetical protein
MSFNGLRLGCAGFTFFLPLTLLAQDATTPPVIAEPSCCAGSSRAASFSYDPFAKQSSWRFADASAWQWTEAEGGNELILQKQNGYKPPFRSPVNLAWFEDREWSSFSLTFECQLSSFTEGNNDLCVAFGGISASQFYYAHLGEKADQAHHQIHIVQQADRKPITTYRTSGTPWKKDSWHKVKVIRNHSTGDIAVWFDDAPQPILTAQDKTFEWGKIALGSFDDEGRFRNIRLRGTSRTTKLFSP